MDWITPEAASAIAIGDYPQLNAKVTAVDKQANGYKVAVRYETGDHAFHEVDVILDTAGIVVRRDEHPVQKAPAVKPATEPAQKKTQVAAKVVTKHKGKTHR